MAWMVTIHCNAETSTVNIYGTKVVKSTTKSSIKSRQRIAKTICHTQKNNLLQCSTEQLEKRKIRAVSAGLHTQKRQINCS
jgi:hypothetical protein